MTALRCHCCGKRLKAYSVTVRTAAGLQGYGPKCGRAMALQACTLPRWTAGIRPEEQDSLRSLVKARGWDGLRIGKARRKRGAPIKPPQIQPDQLTLELEPA